MTPSRRLASALLAALCLFTSSPVEQAAWAQSPKDLIIIDPSDTEEEIELKIKASKSTRSARLSGGNEVVVNGVALSPKALKDLARAAGGPVQLGRYWYDDLSGLWGAEGEALSGQIAPHLKLGGKLQADASQGKTGVFLNGRELPPQEASLVQQLGETMRGRYWVNAEGIGGIENGPALFNIKTGLDARIKQAGGGSKGWALADSVKKP